MRRASKPRVIDGWTRGDIGYCARDGKQYQVRFASVLSGGSCIVTATMQRHRETVDGRETGVWNKWTPTDVRNSKNKFISHTRDIKRSPEEL